MKQLLYGPARRQRLGATADTSSAMMEQEQERALLSELAEGDFSADQNIVEVSPSRPPSINFIFQYYGRKLFRVRVKCAPYADLLQHCTNYSELSGSFGFAFGFRFGFGFEFGFD